MKLKVMRLTTTVACLALDAPAFKGRLALEQIAKDELIFSNLRALAPSILLPPPPAGLTTAPLTHWWNAPFDTNFLMWTGSAGLERAVLEYDGLILFFESFGGAGGAGEQWRLKRSLPTTEEARGYGGPWVEAEAQKVSMGANWQERLMRLLDSHPRRQELAPLVGILASI